MGADARVGEVEVIIYKGGREIDRVRRPLRRSAEGPAVTYRRRLWPLRNGSVNLDRPPIASGTASGSPVRPARRVGPDRIQQALTNRPPSDRVLVDAGPGTGKTHVACARVVALIAQGIPPSRIWLISFTRTAILEIRNRIASALSDPGEAAAVCIATLDSYAWSLQSGFNSDARITGSFDENIQETLKRIQEDDELREYLATRIRHLIIDEGQDIVGVRADLTLALIHAVGESCGVTVFADEAQAIYGFSEEGESRVAEGPSFIEQLREEGFEKAVLSTVHRTSRSNLRNIFVGLRANVLRRTGRPTLRRARIEKEIRANADESDGALTGVKLGSLPENALVLARRRVDVLLYSSMQADVPHRLRLSGLPPCLKPWIGHLLWDWTDALLTRKQFELRWNERSVSAQPASPEANEAWRLLVEVGGRSAATVDLNRAREVLGRANPPALFCTPEFGYSGPILGTIHASKGREADYVALYLPRAGESGEDMDAEASAEEEIRVLFVGATRAREYLRVGHAPAVFASSMNGRAWREIVRSRRGTRRIQIEVGRGHDVTPEGLVGRRIFVRREDAHSVQLFWRNSPVRRNLCARAVRELDWDLVLEDGDRIRLGVLGQQLQSDLREISRVCKTFPPPTFVPHLRSLGARTLAVRPGDPRLELLHEPWRTSGFLSGPLLIGFALCELGDKAWKD